MDEYEKHRSVLGLISQLKPGWTLHGNARDLPEYKPLDYVQ